MKRGLKVLVSSSVFMLLAGGLFGPLYAVFVEEIGGDLLTAGSAYAAFAISAGVVMFLVSKLEDKYDHTEFFVIGGYIMSFLGFIGYLLVKEPWHLFAVQIIFGIGEAIGTPAFDGLYSRLLDKGKFVSEWGIWESLNWVVTGISALIGGAIATLFGFNVLFIIMVILSALGLIVSTLLLRK